jgi:hypothetical protein
VTGFGVSAIQPRQELNVPQKDEGFIKLTLLMGLRKNFASAPRKKKIHIARKHDLCHRKHYNVTGRRKRKNKA